MPLPVQVNGQKKERMMKSIQNEQGYDLWASFYDSYPNATVAADELYFPKYFGHIENKTILDIGCGTGRHSLKLAKQGNRVTGLDISGRMLEVAQSKLIGFPVNFVKADFLAYDGLSPVSFDAAVASLVIEHISDLKTFFLKLSSVLASGGEAFLSEIHPLRIAKGSQARFCLPNSQNELWLTSHAHSEATFIDSIKSSGLLIKESKDLVGDEDFANLRPEWKKYLGNPVLKIWSLNKK